MPNIQFNCPFSEIDKDAFLTQYWQKEPCLFKGAFPDPPNALSADELAGLSLEEDIESRLILNSDKNWKIEHGPFEESRFASLPENNWTLLVQSVDYWHPAVRALLADFTFLPRWRYDDIMVSFATDGGGVGPHSDNYDVFLIQSQGERRWRVGNTGDTKTNAQIINGMSHLSDFTPYIDYVMQPGDMLYIPPDTAHWGVSKGESIGYSIGYRTLQAHQLFALLTEDASEKDEPAQFFTDPYRSISNTSNQLDDQLITWAQSELRKLADSPDQIAKLIGKQLSLSKIDTGRDTSSSIQELTTDSSIKIEESYCVNWLKVEDKILLNIEGDCFEFELKYQNAVSKLASYQAVPISLFNYSTEAFDFPEVLTNLIDRGTIKLIPITS